MKFEVIEREVVSAGAISTKDITLSANAKAFKIIFGQIYPDIIKAIVRELFTNAWDSQKVAGTLHKPIDIHLPSTFEPWFSIRDYGTGMTTDIIDDIYSKVFESSKDDSNEEAGMFGMGSKTPLGYTDGFSVTSYVDGILYAYDIFIGTNGNPQISLNAMEETDQPNGVEVSVAVRTEDFDRFKTHAELFALHAGTPININRQRFLNQREFLIKGNDWVLYKPSANFSEGAYIRMGCVLYQIDVEHIINSTDLIYEMYSVKTRIRNIYNLPMIIDFEIGDFDVTGSREDIIYNSESISKIHERVDSTYEQIKGAVADQVNDAETLSDAYEIANHYYNLNIISADEINKLKYGALKLSIINKYSTASKFRLEMMHAKFSKYGVNKLSKFTNCFDPQLFISNKVTTYIIIDDGKAKRSTHRVENLVEHIKKTQDLGVYKNTATRNNNDSRYVTYLWIKTDDVSKLKRLFAFAPKHYYLINIHDIEPRVVEKRTYEKREKIDSAYYLDYITHTDIIKFTRYHEKVRPNDYYLMIDGRRVTDKKQDIIKAYQILNSHLGKDSYRVALLTDKKTDYISEYNLKNLLEAAKEIEGKIDYSFDTYYYHAFKKISEDFKLNRLYRVWVQYCTDEPGQYIAGFEIDYNNVDISFVPTVNETVALKFEAAYNHILTKLNKLYEKYPVMKYVETYRIRDSLKDILEALGENV